MPIHAQVEKVPLNSSASAYCWLMVDSPKSINAATSGTIQPTQRNCFSCNDSSNPVGRLVSRSDTIHIECKPARNQSTYAGANGLKTATPSALKSATFLVATFSPFTFAVAAIIASS